MGEERPRTLTPQQEAVVLKAYFDNKMKAKEVCETFGITPGVLQGMVRRDGRRKAAARPKIEDRNQAEIDAIVADYLAGDYVYGICTKYHISARTLTAIVKRAGVQRKSRPRRQQVSKEKSQQLCWDCAKATGRCSWSRRLEPVPGWTATKVERLSHTGEIVEGTQITACPEFVKG